MPASDSVDAAIEELRKAIEADITLAWSRKISFETRAFSIITANLALATAFFLLNGGLGYTTITRDGTSRCLLVITLALASISVLGSVLAAVLRNYPGLPAGVYEDELEKVGGRSARDIQLEVVESRAAIYSGAVRSNAFKGAMLIVAFLSLGGATVGYVAALVASAIAS